MWVSTDLGASWTAKPVTPFLGRGDAGVTVDSTGAVFVVGGFGGYQSPMGHHNDVWMSSIDLTTWTQRAQHAPWSGRWGMIVKSFNNSLVLIGGDHGAMYPKDNAIWMSWNAGADWTNVATAQFDGRSDAISEIIGKKLYIAGGDDNNAQTAHINSEVWSTLIDFSPEPEPPTPPTPTPTPTPTPSTDLPFTNWTLVNANAWSPRASAVSAFFPRVSGSIPGRWIVIGGRTSINWTDQALHDAHISDDLGVTWVEVPTPLPFAQVEMAGGVFLNSKGESSLLLTGGIDLVNWTSYGSIYRSDDRGLTFQLVTSNAAWPARTSHGFVTLKMNTEVLVILGGYQIAMGDPTFFNDVNNKTHQTQEKRMA